MRANNIFLQMSAFVLALGFATTALSAELAPEAVLRTVWKDPRWAAHAEAVKLVTDAHSMNPLDKADIRLDRGELNQDDIKVGIRLYPKGYSEHVTTREFQRVLERNERAAQSEALSRMLSTKYELIARMALLREKKQISAELSSVAKKASRALSYSARRDRAELKSYLKTKTDIEKIELKIADVERDYRNLQHELQDLALGPVEQFNLQDIVDMDDIRQKLAGTGSSGAQTTISGQVATLDLAVTRAEVEYERAKDEKWLEHVEVSIKDDKGEKVYGIEIALNLPFTASTDLSKVSKHARELREKAKMLETVDSTDRLLKNTIGEIQTLLELHKSMHEGQKAMNPDQMKKASQSIASQDPMLAVELQRGWFEAKEQLLDLEFRIRSLFIVYLHEASVIASAPESNHLSKSVRKIL